MRADKSFKEIQKRNRKIFNISLLVCVLLGVILIITLYKYLGVTIISLALQIVTSLIIALFTILVVDRYFKSKTQEGHDKYVKDTILDLLSVENSEIINDFYDKKKIKKVVNNCIQATCDKFARDVYLNIFEKTIERFREDFVYLVMVSEPKQSITTNGELMTHFGEEIKYTKYIRTNLQVKQDVCHCFFAFDDNTLNKAFDKKEFNDGTFFFRGILKNDSLIEMIKNSSSKEKILTYLNFKICFQKRFDDNSEEGMISNDDINVELRDNGVLFSVDVPKEYLSFTDNFTYYRAKMECEFPVKENIFYCVFSEPTVSTNVETQFRICFLSDVIKNPGRIKYLVLLSCDDDTLKREGKTNSWVFSTRKAIFPRSGFVVHW